MNEIPQQAANNVLKQQNPQRLDFCADPEFLTLDRMLCQAAEWQSGHYANSANREVVCRYVGTDLFEFEMVCVGDLFNAMQQGVHPVFKDSAYRLLEDWSHSSRSGETTNCEGFLKHGIRQQLFELSYAVPISLGSQIQTILQTWSYLKFDLQQADCFETITQLVTDLGWFQPTQNIVPKT